MVVDKKKHDDEFRVLYTKRGPNDEDAFLNKDLSSLLEKKTLHALFLYAPILESCTIQNNYPKKDTKRALEIRE